MRIYELKTSPASAPTVRALAILWHPPEGGHAGGFLLSRRLLEGGKRYRYTIVDSETTDIDPTASGIETVHLLRERRLYTRDRRLFAASRIVNWLVHIVAATFAGLRARDFDVVIAHASEIIANAIPALIVGRIRRRPVIFMNLNVRGQRFWTINRIVHGFADGIVTISADLERELQTAIPGARTARFPVGTDDFAVPRRETPRYDAVFIGRHVAEKGIFELLDVWQRCRTARPHARLAMAGPIEPSVRATLRRAISDRGLRDAVDVLGPIDEAAKWDLYADARLCVFPSWFEGWGIVPLEAHLAGLPVVAYSLGAYDEHIAASPYTTLVPLHDVAAMANAVLAHLESTRDRSGTRGWAMRFGWPEAIERAERATDDLRHASQDRNRKRGDGDEDR